MNPILYQIMLRTLSYLLLVLIILVLFNLLTQGFAWTYARVFGSFGKKVLVTVFGVTRRYFRVGEISGSRLRFKNSKGEWATCAVTKKDVFRMMAVTSIEVDEESGNVRRADGSAGTGYDPVKIDSMIQRALALRNLEVDRIAIASLLVILLVLAGVGFLAFKMFTLEALIKAISTKGVV